MEVILFIDHPLSIFYHPLSIIHQTIVTIYWPGQCQTSVCQFRACGIPRRSMIAPYHRTQAPWYEDWVLIAPVPDGGPSQ